MKKPNILLILNDDMGYSDIGCYGGEIQTPVLDSLAAQGLRYTQFYNTARCCPSRASLLTGLHPHQADVGHMMLNDDVDGYLGDLSQNSATIAEVLKGNGYQTMMSGKWHVTGYLEGDRKDNWPCQRGFDKFYGMLAGAASYFDPHTLTRDNDPLPTPEGEFYFTDALTDAAIEQLEQHFEHSPGNPFFQYLAYTAPHWPLHAREKDIAKYEGCYDQGWDKLRESRLQRMCALGLIDAQTALSPRDTDSLPWSEAEDKAWEARRMEVYAAQIDRMDQGIGRVLETLRLSGELENTIIFFLSDNGGCAESITPDEIPRLIQKSARPETRDGRPVRFGNQPDIVPGPEDTYTSYGLSWANASNTPFRKFKCWVHEGGIATPFIVHWPAGLKRRGELRHQPAQLPDIMATILEVTDSCYPEKIACRDIKPHEGFSLVPTFQDLPHAREVLAWEHEGNCGLRKGPWKLVREFARPWELYDICNTRNETEDLSARYPEIVVNLVEEWERWAAHCGVIPREELLALRRKRSEKQRT